MSSCHRAAVLFYFLPLLLQICSLCDGLVVGAPSKIIFNSGPEGIKSTAKLLVIITHPPPPAVISAHVLSHDHLIQEHLIESHLHTTAVSTTSLQAVHNNDPVVPSVTQTVTQISHPASHHHVLPHPASTVNGHSLGYGPSTIDLYKSYDTSPPTHETNVYTVHIGGFGVGLHVGGHGHGHGYFAVL